MTATRRPHVVIVGGGFGGLRAARHLRRADVDVTLVDRTNHHLFQPLLYQVATATLAPSDISVPIRWLLRRQKNTRVLMAQATAVDLARRTVTLDGGEPGERELAWDYLVLAAGARHSYFGHSEWERDAPGLKSLEDAFDIRRRFLLAFENAEKETDPADREAYMTFVLVGGGPTGVELAGIIPDVARYALVDDFREIDTRRTRVILVEGGSRLLPSFPEALSERARRDLERLGVEVRLESIVTAVSDRGVHIGDEFIPARTVFWAAGNAASPLARSLGVPLDRAGRVEVERDLSLPGHPEVFAVGDMAGFTHDGQVVPGVAPAANQMGRLAAHNILRDLAAQPRAHFRYRDKGNLATIGRHRAIADFGRLRLTGYVAWWFWLFIHIMYLVGFRNRVSVLIQWAYAYFTYQRGVRLITGSVRKEYQDAPARGPVLAPKW
jgi:NADH:ubiquinone reductase (H+-translocating)